MSTQLAIDLSHFIPLLQNIFKWQYGIIVNTPLFPYVKGRCVMFNTFLCMIESLNLYFWIKTDFFLN